MLCIGAAHGLSCPKGTYITDYDIQGYAFPLITTSFKRKLWHAHFSYPLKGRGYEGKRIIIIIPGCHSHAVIYVPLGHDKQ